MRPRPRLSPHRTAASGRARPLPDAGRSLPAIDFTRLRRLPLGSPTLRRMNSENVLATTDRYACGFAPRPSQAAPSVEPAAVTGEVIAKKKEDAPHPGNRYGVIHMTGESGRRTP